MDAASQQGLGRALCNISKEQLKLGVRRGETQDNRREDTPPGIAPQWQRGKGRVLGTSEKRESSEPQGCSHRAVQAGHLSPGLRAGTPPYDAMFSSLKIL